MNQFLDETSLLVVTCIHEKLDSFVNRIVAFLSDTESKWSTEQAPLDLGRVYSGSPPRGGGDPFRVAMWTPRTLADWTAWYVNSQDGWSHLFGKLSQAGGPDTVCIRSTLPNAEGGVQEFIYRKANIKEYGATRLLQWLKEEGGYELINRGEPLPFERVGPKKSNPIKTRQDLLCFVRAFGIDLEAEAFWQTSGDAVYLSETWL